MLLKHICRVCLALVVISLVSSGFGVMYASAEGTVTIGIQDASTSFDPAIVRESFTRAVLKNLYENLVTFEGEDFTTAIPQLAESWELQEDGKTWLFSLRQGITFSSGNSVNADAVVYSFQRALKLGGQPTWLLKQFGINEEAISSVDEYTVKIELDRQYAPSLFLACLAHGVTSIVDPLLQEHEKDGDLGSEWLNTHSAGSGRFIMSERVAGESFTFKANEKHWQGKPQVDTLLVKNVPEPFEQALLLEQGELDVAWNIGTEEVNKLEENFDVQLYTSPTLKVRFLAMNLGYEPLAKSEVRDAIRYAIDYDAIIDFILQGAATKIQTIVPKGVLGHNPETPYSPDIEKAKALLAEAGYSDGFEIELACEEYAPWIDMAYQIKRNLSEIGINVTINAKASLGDLLKHVFSRKTQIFLAKWELDYVDPDAISKPFAHCDSLGDDATVKIIAWLVNYLNPELASLIEEATREQGMEKRNQMYQEITGIVLDDGPYAILHSPSIQYGVRLEKRELIGLPSPYLTSFPKIN